MSTTTVVHAQRLIVRAQARAARVADAHDLVAHDERVARNLAWYGPGQGLADGMRAQDASAARAETWRRPGLRTFFWPGVLGAAFAAAVEQAPHGVPWSWATVLAAFVVTGSVVWLVRYGVFATKARAGRQYRAAASAAAPMIGCGDPACPLEPCTTHFADPIDELAAVDLDAELRSLEHAARTVPGDLAGDGRAEIVHRPAPACPDCIASTRLDPDQPPGMVGLITVHEPTCPYYAHAAASAGAGASNRRTWSTQT